MAVTSFVSRYCGKWSPLAEVGACPKMSQIVPLQMKLIRSQVFPAKQKESNSAIQLLKKRKDGQDPDCGNFNFPRGHSRPAYMSATCSAA